MTVISSNLMKPSGIVGNPMEQKINSLERRIAFLEQKIEKDPELEKIRQKPQEERTISDYIKLIEGNFRGSIFNPPVAHATSNKLNYMA